MPETNYEVDVEPILYRVMDYRTFNSLVRKHFNNPKYEIADDQELSNDSIYEGDTNFVPSSYHIEKMERFRQGERVQYMPVDYLLAELAVNGVIPPCNYLIRISW